MLWSTWLYSLLDTFILMKMQHKLSNLFLLVLPVNKSGRTHAFRRFLRMTSGYLIFRKYLSITSFLDILCTFKCDLSQVHLVIFMLWKMWNFVFRMEFHALKMMQKAYANLVCQEHRHTSSINYSKTVVKESRRWYWQTVVWMKELKLFITLTS